MSSRDGPPALLGREWNNVGRGEIQTDLTIPSDWFDVPRGGIDGGGTVDFKIGPDSAGNVQITKTSETGSGRGDTVWTRCEPGFQPADLLGSRTRVSPHAASHGASKASQSRCARG